MAQVSVKVAEKQVENTSAVAKPTCGIVMPISAIDGCSEKHWKEVKGILTDAIESTGYEANLVSNADDVGIIQKRIVQNLYDNDIVVCDVSCKNANVMFELGLRLAFDKPTIIVIDDKTNYSFDTAIIEHLSYPRDLSYYSIVDFKEKLKNKIQATIKKSQEDTSYSPFLKNFGEFKVASIEHKEGSINDAVLLRLDELTKLVTKVTTPISPTFRSRFVESNEVRQKINDIVATETNNFVNETGISLADLYANLNNEKKQLQDYLEKNPQLRQLCRRPSRMAQAIEDYLSF